jgi:transposase
MELKAMHRLGWTVSQLAREFGLSRTTVYKELASAEPRRYGPRERPAALTEAQLVHVERRLVICPGILGTDLHAELRADYGYAGGYHAFERQLRLLRPAVVRDPEIRFETGPAIQTQADWAHLGLWQLGDRMVELHAMVAILGFSRAPAIRFELDTSRKSSFRALVRCLDDLGGVTREVLTDRDPAFCIGATANGAALLAPSWVELCELLAVVPRACRPYRAKTKGKVERMVRELKDGFLPWLSGQLFPPAPTLATYDVLARRWIELRILPRVHRTTSRQVGPAWQEERAGLNPIPARLLAGFEADDPAVRPALGVVDPELHARGAHAEVRDLTEYEVAL